MKAKAKVLDFDKANSEGQIYSIEAKRRIVEEFKKSIGKQVANEVNKHEIGVIEDVILEENSVYVIISTKGDGSGRK